MNKEAKLIDLKVKLYNLLEELNEELNDNLPPWDSELLAILEGDETIQDELNDRY